jgi:streptogramin lyase
MKKFMRRNLVMKKLLLTGILLMSILAALAGCGGGKSSTGPAGAKVTTIAGSAGPSGSTDAIGTAARFFQPGGIAIDGNGNLYVSDTYNSTIRKLTKNGTAYTVTTIAGSVLSTGSTNGVGLTQAKFNYPEGIAVDSNGDLYVADTNNCSIRKLTKNGTAYTVTTIAGLANNSGSTDGTGTAARFSGPYGITINGNGNLFVVEIVNNTIRKITF